MVCRDRGSNPDLCHTKRMLCQQSHSGGRQIHVPTVFEIYITLNKIIEISELSVSLQNLTVISCSLVEVVWRADRTRLQKPRHHKPNVKYKHNLRKI